MKPLVVYHAHCTDGFGAAFAAWMHFGDNAEYVPMHYNNSLAHDVKGRLVYVLDFSFPLEEHNRIRSEAFKFVMLDHHKTAFEALAGGLDSPLVKDGKYEVRGYRDDNYNNLLIRLDNNKSGAMLAWEYFHPGTEVPYIIQRIDDRDRWVFQYEDSRALHAGLNAQPFKFEAWKMLTPMGTNAWGRNYNDVVSRGQMILGVYHEQIKHSVKGAERCALPNPNPDPAEVSAHCEEWELPYEQAFAEVAHRTALSGLAVNTPQHISEVGHELASASGTYGLVWYYDGKAKMANCSLRSNGDYDVSAIAKAFGGGGHKNAAGFRVPMHQLLEWLQ
jgi:uncharacterized protein